ncbi:MAG: hypothetical protein JSW59_16865, partial [Phycisphaerales bacterium]
MAKSISLLALLVMPLISIGCSTLESSDSAVVIVSPADATAVELLATKEIRRYLYLRTGELPPIVRSKKRLPSKTDLIIVGRKDRPVVKALTDADADLASSVDSLESQQYVLKTISLGGKQAILIAGGDSIGTLYGAYRFAENLGVRFYLHGDTIPEERVPFRKPELDEVGKPLFNTRGIQPFHDFPEGPDWWNTDDYKAVIAQLPKLRMNFFGLHTYPQGGVGPEPTVWIGLPSDFNDDGTVKFSYPSRHFTTANVTGAWGYQPTKTGDYSFGASQMFERDDYGADYMHGMNPWTKLSAEKSNELFDRMGNMLNEAFRYAHALGVKTCVGTETPLVIPGALKERLKAKGKNPSDPAVVQELYEGMFQRIAKTYPLDYYWFWTPEGWTWRDPKGERVEATLADFKAAVAAAEKVNAPFTLATCGWVLGPPKDRALFDNSLPKEMPMSCINRNVGFAPVEPGFANIEGRPQWAIPWLEDDPAMIIPQLWAGRMRRDAADALAYGCTGLLGIHWRTRILGPNVSALAHAGWEQEGWNPDFGKTAASPKANTPRDLSAEDFYADWALAQFGPQVAEPMAEFFTNLDGGPLEESTGKRKANLPRPSTWVRGPGGINPDSRPWKQVGKEYAFVEEMAKLRPKVKGKGYLERFDYWLNNFRYLRAVGRVNCTWGRFNEAMKKVKTANQPKAQQRLARDRALPIRKELAAQVADVHRYLLTTVNTNGAMGNVTNWQQHI